MANRYGKPSLHDYLTLLAVKMAKGRKRKYTSTKATEFYDEHFEERHTYAYMYDIRAVLRRQEIQKFIDTLSSDLVIADLGCGVGDILSGVKTKYSAIGMDFSFHSLLLAKKVASGIPLINGSLDSLPFRDSCLDVVICLEVLEHLDDDRLAVREISRILRRGGYLIVSVPSHYYFSDYFDLMGHFRHYTRSQLVQLLGDAGFTVVRYLNHYPRTIRLYLYVYWGLVVVNSIIRRIMHDRKTLYERQVPFSSRPIYQQVIVPLFQAISKLDNFLQLGQIESSTFCVAQKR